jgi:hypothetical protein
VIEDDRFYEPDEWGEIPAEAWDELEADDWRDLFDYYQDFPEELEALRELYDAA